MDYAEIKKVAELALKEKIDVQVHPLDLLTLVARIEEFQEYISSKEREIVFQCEKLAEFAKKYDAAESKKLVC